MTSPKEICSICGKQFAGIEVAVPGEVADLLGGRVKLKVCFACSFHLGEWVEARKKVLFSIQDNAFYEYDVAVQQKIGLMLRTNFEDQFSPVSYNVNKKIIRGDIWYHKPGHFPSGHIQGGNRPVIIVSNDMANQFSPVLLAVPCTTKSKRKKPTHVQFDYNGRINLAMTEQVGPVSVDHLVTFNGVVSEETLEQIDAALLIALGMDETFNAVNAHKISKRPVQVDGGYKYDYTKGN